MSRLRVLVIILCVLVIAAAIRFPMAMAQRQSLYAAVDPIIDVLGLITSQYYEEAELEALQKGAITGMLEALNDPYTEYIPLESLAEFDKAVQGRFVGVGAQVRLQDGWTLIFTPMPESPALRAGVQAGDLVVAVDGRSVYEMPLTGFGEEEGVIDWLTGEPGTEVRVTIERESASPPADALEASVPGEVALDDGRLAPGPEEGRVRFDVVITRAPIVTPTVLGLHRRGGEWTYMVDPERKIAYVRITQFTGGTIAELEELSRRLMAEHGLGGLILDLRFNAGGALEAAVEMSRLFLEGGTIVSVRGRQVNERVFSAERPGSLVGFPMAVLVNNQSASASEIVAGALADNGRAIVIGERTFGKGLVQGLHELPSGRGQLKLTQSRYYLPSGRLLHREDDSSEWGVDPTPGFYLPLEGSAYSRIVELQREEEIILPEGAESAGEWEDPGWILDHFEDPHLRAAVEAIRGKLDTGVWTPASEDEGDPSEAISARELAGLERSRDALLRQIERIEERIEASSTGAAVAEEERDLWPDETEVVDGFVEVYDVNGELVRRLRITDDSIELWLADAPLEGASEPAESP